LPGEVITPTSGSEVEDQAEHLLCSACGSDRIKRIARSGLLQKHLYPLFGRYPWKCARCGVTSAIKMRSRSKRRTWSLQESEKNVERTSVMETPNS